MLLSQWLVPRGWSVVCVGWGASVAAAIALVRTSGAAAGEVDLGKGVAVPLWGGHGGHPTRAPKLKPPLFALGRSRSEYTAADDDRMSRPRVAILKNIS